MAAQQDRFEDSQSQSDHEIAFPRFDDLDEDPDTDSDDEDDSHIDSDEEVPWNLDGNIDEVSFHETEPCGEVERDNIEGDLLTYLVYRLSLSLYVDQFTEGLP